ncbi:DUF3304 domain-containing protein [Variovorax sp. OV329]|uniref:DUF3304 domain-containing protein n=1 Tax=Variovorax sp. OV329 TaxID=1882825 RepID=UPI001587EB5B|nr:DUF3304 domain-containing protein [Variovorax sp. OV329]
MSTLGTFRPSHPTGAKRSFIDIVRCILATIAAALIVAGCSNTAYDLVPDKNKMGVPVGVVTHYGSKIGLPDIYLDGHWLGSAAGWGGGTAGRCCALLPREIPNGPVMVKVKWITYRSNVEEKLEHEATVPVNFAVRPGDSSGVYVHLLPGHKAEVWVSWPAPGSTEYPGPAYPRGPAKVYAPLPGEKPQPTSDD